MTLLLLASNLIVLPFAMSKWAVDTTYALVGVSLALLMIGGNTACLEFWGKRSNSYLQALHFCLSLGILTGTSVIDPLAQTRVPQIVQDALKMTTTTTFQNSTNVVGTLHLRAKRSVTPDPLLAQLFGQKRPKPKPAFTDALKLDNSQDWDLIKVAQPPLEELVAPTSTSTVSTSSSTPNLIQHELNQLQLDMKASQDLQTWLKRSKRDLRKNNGGFGGYEPPPLYNQQRIPQQQKYWPQEEPMRPRLSHKYDWANPYAPYDEQRITDMYGSDYSDIPQRRPTGNDLELPPAPPEKVEQAFETIEKYLEDPEKVQKEETETKTTDKLTTTTTTTISTTSTSTTTTQTTSTTTMYHEIHTSTKTHHKKPTSSFDNDTEVEQNSVTIGKVLNNYGVAKNHVGFILDATYMFALSVVLLLCMCYRPREPRTRHHEHQVSSSGTAEEPATFKMLMTILLFLVNIMQEMMFLSLSNGLPAIQESLSHSPMSMQQVFFSVFTLTRFLAIFTSGVLSPAITLTLSLVVCLFGSVSFVIAKEVMPGSSAAGTAILWIGVVELAVSI